MIRLSQKRLRWLFILFFLALAIPSSILSWKAYEQLKWEAFHQYQQEAQSLAQQIDNALMTGIASEEGRADTDYTFLVLAGDPNARFVQRSVLSKYPVESNLPGVIGYFQVDENGEFSSPLMPTESTESSLYGISTEEQLLRSQLAFNLQSVLAQNRLVSNINIGQRNALKADAKVDEDEARLQSQLQSTDETSEEVSAPSFQSDSALASISENKDVAMKEMEQQKKEELERTLIAMKENVVKRQKSEGLDAGFGQLQSAAGQAKISDDYANKAPSNTKLKKGYATKLAEEKTQLDDRSVSRKNRLEKKYSPQQSIVSADESLSQFDNQGIQISLFESELEPFRFSLLSSGHCIAYRQVWRNKQRVIQGVILSTEDFINSAIKKFYIESNLSNLSSLNVVYADNLLKSYQGETDYTKSYLSSRSRRDSPLKGELLLASSLSEPFNQLTLVFNVTDMPAGAGADFIGLVAFSLLSILVLGTYLLFRLTLKQMSLAQQQQDFVSAVSHELKTPLTSIRMYGEILKQGWVSEEKKLEYYDYIFNESERLSRLIANVLQISKVSRNALIVELKSVQLRELANLILSKIDSQIKQSEFILNLEIDDGIKESAIDVDADAFIQIIINLVDNAIKYSGKAKKKQVDILFKKNSDDSIQVSVRDYGPGIRKSNIKKIFELFYRTGDELTRECTGTGIGLALVKELSHAMQAKVEVFNHAIGVEFIVRFKRKSGK